MAGEPVPRLELVAAGAIRFHERPEARRTRRLVERLRADARLRNPPIVAQLRDGAHLLLDGANRVSAFRELGLAEVPAQIVDYADHGIELRGWHHLLVDPSGLDLGRAYAALDGVAVREVGAGDIASLLELREVFAVWVDRDARARGLFPAPGRGAGPPSLAARMRVLTAVIAAYEGASPLERVKLAAYDNLPAVIRGRAHELCLFPVLTKEELVRLVRGGHLIPTGITRHLIPGRVLGLNVELGFLRSLPTRAEREARFRAHLERLELEGRIRYYEEPVFILNE